MLWRASGWAAKCAAPLAPSSAPSVERKTSEYGSLIRCAAAVGAYERASSINAAVPEALSSSPPPGAPLLSRCAMTTISARGESPAFSATRLTSVVRWPWIVAVNRSARTSKPYGASSWRNHVSAPLAPGVPGLRSG